MGGSDFLFVRPSFVKGMGRAIDVFGCLDSYNISRTPEEADARAIYSDWVALSKDVGKALDQVLLEAAAR